jgi:MoxR-like ATPase
MAFYQSRPGLPAVLLIDEIDKSDIDMPNDLLHIFEEGFFEIPELTRLKTGDQSVLPYRGQEDDSEEKIPIDRGCVSCKEFPLVFMTSNEAREFPPAFLRRCFFHYIKFPEKETMQQIVDVHFPNLKKNLLAQAMQTFYDVRDIPGLKKKPSTSELLDWLKLLLAEDIPPEALRSQDQKAIVPPLHGALLKNEQDVHLFERLVFMSRNNR